MMIQGINKSEHPRMYWRAELDYCRCVLEGFGDNPQEMRLLQVRIRQLRAEHKTMGGLYPEFNAVEAEAKKRAGAKPSPQR